MLFRSEAHEHLKEVDKFVERFRAATTDEILDECVRRAEHLQGVLLERRLIEPLPESFNQNWRERMVALRANSSKLGRLFTGYEKFDLPYDASNQEDINNLYESLLDSVNLSRRRNAVMKKVLAADESRDLASLKLEPAERDDIAEAMRDAMVAYMEQFPSTFGAPYRVVDDYKKAIKLLENQNGQDS